MKFILFPLIFIFVSCGSQKPMVEDIKVRPYYDQNDVYVSLSAHLSIGNVSLPHASFPIYAPRSFEEIGHVSMSSLLGSKNLLEISLNLSAVSNLDAQYARLPNGSSLPLIGNNKTIVIPIDKKVELYVALGEGNAAIGVSIPFKNLDGLGSKVGQSSLFPVFNINEILGAAGIYTSKTRGKNGFGLFADVSSALEPVMLLDLGLNSGIQRQQHLDANSIIPSAGKEKRINKEMYKLHSRRERLRLN